MDPEAENHELTNMHQEEKALRKFRKRKRSKISSACQNLDTGKLIDLATTRGGLLHDELRKEACKS